MYRCRRYGTLVCCILIGFKPGATAKEIRLVGHIPSGEYMRIAGPALLIDDDPVANRRSEEHTSELQSLMRISYAVFCLKKKIRTHIQSSKSNTNNATTT